MVGSHEKRYLDGSAHSMEVPSPGSRGVRLCNLPGRFSMLSAVSCVPKWPGSLHGLAVPHVEPAQAMTLWIVPSLKWRAMLVRV